MVEPQFGDGARLPKFQIRITANGLIDEVNPFIGLTRLDSGDELGAQLRRVQNDLFDIDADLCWPECSVLKFEPLRFTVCFGVQFWV